MESQQAQKRTLSLGWIWLAWLALAVTFLGFTVFGFVARGDPTPLIERVFGDTGRFAFVLYTAGQAAAALALVFLTKRRGFGIRDLGFRGRLTRQGALFAIAGWFVSFWLYYVVGKLLGLAGIRMFWNESKFLSLDSVSRIVIAVVATLIVAPIAEELIYRGYVFQAFNQRMRAPRAAVLSALVFASIHVGIGPGLAIYIFFGALILAYLCWKFRNIYACVLMHLVNNIVAYFVIPLVVLE